MCKARTSIGVSTKAYKQCSKSGDPKSKIMVYSFNIMHPNTPINPKLKIKGKNVNKIMLIQTSRYNTNKPIIVPIIMPNISFRFKLVISILLCSGKLTKACGLGGLLSAHSRLVYTLLR